MALIKAFTNRLMDRPTLHEEIEASYSVFEKDGRKLMQIDSYGRESRQIPGKKSQTIQLDKEGATSLFKILQREFDLR